MRETVKTPTVTEIDYGASNPIAELEKLAISLSTRRALIAHLEAEDDIDKNTFFDLAEKTFGYQGIKVTNPRTGEIVQTTYTVTQKIDDDKVRKLVSPEMWRKIKKETVDSKLFHSAIALGEIKAMEVADAIKDQTVRKIYVRPPAR